MSASTPAPTNPRLRGAETIEVWVYHYDYHRPHTACGDQPPASRLHAGVDNVMTNYS